MLKTKLASILTVLLLGLTAAGCGSTNSSSNGSKANDDASTSAKPAENKEPVTLTFLERWPNQPYKNYFDSVISEFQKNNPNIKINVVTALNDDYKQKINVLLGNNNPPDIFFSWVGEYGDKFIRDGRALDITKYVQEDKGWSDQILPSQLAPFTMDKKVYGVPFFMDGKVFFYNKDLFDKNQIQVPKTWTEFIGALDKLKAAGATPIEFGNKSPWAGGHYLTTLNQRVVAPDVLAKDYNLSTAQFTDAGYVKALNLFQQLLPYFNNDVNAVSHEDARNAFIGGKAAIIYLETMEATYMKSVSFNWNTFNFPAIEDGKGDQNELTGAPEGFMVSAKTKYPDEAVKFLKFLTSKPMAEKLVKETGMPSVVKGAINTNTATPKEVELADQVAKASNMAIWIDTVLDGKVFTPYLASTQQLLNKQKTPEQVMKDVQAALK